MVSELEDLGHVLLIESKDAIEETRLFLERDGYYDSSRRVGRTEDGHFALPITSSAATKLLSSHGTSGQTANNSNRKVELIKLLYNDTECHISRIKLLPSKSAIARSKNMKESLKSSLRQALRELEPPLLEERVKSLMSNLPSSWDRHGDLILLPQESFSNSEWRDIIPRLPDFWGIVACGLSCQRLAHNSGISPDRFRSSRAILVVGKDPWVEHIDNGIKYVFDVTRIMFSSGNITEKLRLAQLDCRGEVVVDLYAGIGYFTLPYLVHSRADLVHACEWNPAAVKGLRRGLVANGVMERCVIHKGDCREVCPRGVADRVNLGLIPSSEGGWATACSALRPDTGGWLHIHGNVAWKHGNRLSRVLERNPWEEEEEERDREICEESVVEQSKIEARKLWTEYVISKINTLLEESQNRVCDGEKRRKWRVKLERVGTVKSYAPFVDHVVVDLECRPDFGTE